MSTGTIPEDKPTAPLLGLVLGEGLGPLVERIGSPPDTHCWDDDCGKDCWSYSPQMVAELLAAERERWEPVAWQQRYLCPEEGPSIWQHCNDSDAAILAKRTDYELRRVYALRA